MARAVLFGSYELIERIGEGGMAEVWRARSRGAAGFEKTVVIKRVLPSLMAKSGFADLLVREAKIAALLSHPNIVQIFDLGEEQGAYFIAMEYVHGRDLASLMGQAWRIGKPAADRAGFTLPLRLFLVAEAAKALDYAHRRRDEEGRPLQIVHRDISPQNILISYEGLVKVTDFGIARADQEGLGKDDDPGVLRGKYAYMSPEQARGEPLDRRADIFSLGIVLYELCAGHRLFRAGDARETLRRVRAADVPPLDVEALGAPIALDDVLRRGLAANRDERYGSARELMEGLTEVIAACGVRVGEQDIADAMHKMFPPEDQVRPNKLRVDLLMRAYDDATRASQPPVLDPTLVNPTAESTEVGSSSWQRRTEARPGVLLVTSAERVPGSVFGTAVSAAGGLAFPEADGRREALFGHAAGSEHAARLAGRVAFELRRQAALWHLSSESAPMVLAAGDVKVLRDMVVPADELVARGAELYARTRPGEVRADASLRHELGWTFRLHEPGDGTVLVDGYRSRSERHTVLLRRGGPLVGRADEMRRLSGALVRASEGEGNSVLLIGEPGSGKSRILAELYAVAAAQDCVCLLGRTQESDAREYGVVADALRDLCGFEEEDDVSVRTEKVRRLRVLGVGSREADLVADLLRVVPRGPRPSRSGRPRAIELLVLLQKALRALSRDRTVLFALEDLHWADDGTRQLLPLLLRGLGRSRVLTVLTSRPGTALPSISARRYELGPLPERATARLFAARLGGRVLSEELSERLVEATGGNPSWVESVAAEMEERGLVEVEDSFVGAIAGAELGVPPSRYAAIGARLAVLPELHRDLLRAIAAFERPVDPATLATVLEMPLDLIETPLGRLLAQWVLRSHDEPEIETKEVRIPSRGRTGWAKSSFKTEPSAELPRRLWIYGGSLVRRALLATMPDGDRRRLHRRIAEVLERAGAFDDDDRVDELAHHAAEALDAKKAPGWLMRAGEVLHARGNNRQAAERFARAARILRDGETDPTRQAAAAATLRAAELALEGGDADLAERVLRILHDTGGGDESDPRLRVRLALARGRVLSRVERWADAATALETVAGEVDGIEDPALRTQMRLALGEARLETGTVTAGLDALERAAEAEPEVDVVLRGRALCALAVGRAWRGDVAGANEAVARALAAAAHLGHGELRYASLAAMAEVQEAGGAAAQAADRWKEAAEVARREGLTREVARASLRAAIALLEIGREPEAAVAAEEAARLGRRHRLSTTTLLAQAVQGALAIRAHPDPTYFPKLVRAVERLEELGRLGDAAVAVRMLAHAHVALADGEAAARSLERAAAFAHEAGRAALEDGLRARHREMLGA